MELGTVIRMPVRLAFKLILVLCQLFCGIWFLYSAYDIRLYSIKDFGMLIHEFDPWFNYRATEYLAEHGLSKFFKWFDYMSWYPLGRPVGTTIYPGMQMTAVAIRETMLRIPAFTYKIPKVFLVTRTRRFLNGLRKAGFLSIPMIPGKIEYVPMSVNDICCMIPPWFGVIASLFTGLITYEVTRSTNAGIMAVGIMAIIPAHLMRSVGGEYDNEAVAVAAICATFWLWLRSVRTPRSWPVGVFAGLSYIYMVAAWGGYIFVINMIGIHAAMLVGLGRFNTGVHRAYTLFYIIGTIGAMQVPVVGWQPVRSLEQMGPLLVFLGFQVLAYCDFVRRRDNMTTSRFVFFRARMVALFLVALAVTAVLLYPTGYFGPLSARIRGLFVKHTKTGNPLVDSVAEHQPASSGIYASYLNLPLDYAWHGALVCLFKRNNGAYFIALYGFIAMHFSGKMSRLVLICGPITSIACAVWCGFLLDFMIEPFLLILGKKGYRAPAVADGNSKPKAEAKSKAENKENKGKADSKSKADKKGKASSAVGTTTASVAFEIAEWEEDERPGGMMQIKRKLKMEAFGSIPEDLRKTYYQTRTDLDSNMPVLVIRAGFSFVILFYIFTLSGMVPKTKTFVDHCHTIARQLANPKVVTWGRDRVKGYVKIDDYLKGYEWIDANTPKDARVIAWWDYGYQITGIAKRTSIADGNTWNHEHIATLGRTLTSPEKKAWNVIRHIADYLLVWAGGGGDDLGKSPHLARIGNSVFPDHCGDDDPKCMKFGFYGQDHNQPTQMMAKSLLYKAVMHNLLDTVRLNSRLFKEVHTTRNGRMRIYEVMNVSQESKQWIADPNNRVCDAPGSWYCVGQYPPALDKLIAKRRSFSQVEDFNKQGAKSAYTKMIERERRGGSEL